MKKFLSLLCAAVLVLSASAAPFAKVARKDLKSAAQLPKIENLEFQRITTPLFVDHKAIVKAPAAKQDVAAPAASAFLQAMFWGSYNDYENKTQGDMSWVLTFLAADTTYVGEVNITTEASNKIAVEQEVSGWAVFAAGDTAQISGAISLEATGFSTYHVVLQAADVQDQDRVWNIETDFEVSAINYLYFYMYQLAIQYYMQTQDQQYLEYAQMYYSAAPIELDDYEVAPTGESDTLIIADAALNDKVTAAGWWVIGGYTSDSIYVQFSNADSIDHILGTYELEDLDLTYSYISDGTTKVKFNGGSIVVTQNENGTYHVAGTLTAKDGVKYVVTMDTKLKVLSDNVITLNYNSVNRTVAVSTTNNDPYFIYIESKAEYDQYQSDFSQESLVNEIGEWIYAIQRQGSLDNFTLTGNQTIDCVSFFGQYAATGDYVVLAAPIENGVVNGTAAYLLFHFDYPEAIENAEDGAKAVKRFENGQLIIEKNGIKYNALGVRL